MRLTWYIKGTETFADAVERFPVATIVWQSPAHWPFAQKVFMPGFRRPALSRVAGGTPNKHTPRPFAMMGCYIAGY